MQFLGMLGILLKAFNILCSFVKELGTITLTLILRSKIKIVGITLGLNYKFTLVGVFLNRLYSTQILWVNTMDCQNPKSKNHW